MEIIDMDTHNAPTNNGNDPPKKRLTVASKINDYRPKLFATLEWEGIWAWNKYDKTPQLIKREEIEAFFAECKAWIERDRAEEEQDGEQPDSAEQTKNTG
jgi:hypothetical protein